MNRIALYSMLMLSIIVIPVSGAQVDIGVPEGKGEPVDPLEYLRHSLEKFPVVCLAEGGHQAREPHQFLRRVLEDKSILRSVDVILVEFAASRYQAVLDAYVGGEEIPFSELSRVWRETGQSPYGPWDSPLYHDLLKTIRKGNRSLPADERVRVLAGDPPIDWEKIVKREDYGRNRDRDSFAASLAMKQAFELKKRVLIIFGGAHLPRIPVGGEDDPRNSIAYRILKEHPGTVRTIGFLDPENLGCEDRIDGFVRDKIYPTAKHWVGDIKAELFFQEIFSLVTDEKTGRQSWQRTPLYKGYRVRDLFDALVYIGPANEWGHEPSSYDRKRDEEYLKELNRRSLIRFGRPFDPGQ